MKNKNCYLVFAFLSFFLSGCGDYEEHNDTPTTGYLTISVDETFKPLIDSEVFTFESIYKYADVNVQYKPEADAFRDLMDDSIKVIIVSRPLNKDEIKEFERWEIVPKVTKIAYDAVALIGSNDLRDSTLTISQIKSVISGDSKGTLKNTKVVFDNSNSSTVNFLLSKTEVKILAKNCYALKSNEEVLNYISQGKNSIGIIGVNWISDIDDTTHLNFIKNFKVLSISLNDSSESLKPYQAYVATKNYPLWREVYVISKEPYTGLGTGLTAFIASERGQRIVLKYGLVPAIMPIRLVELVENEDLL